MANMDKPGQGAGMHGDKPRQSADMDKNAKTDRDAKFEKGGDKPMKDDRNAKMDKSSDRDLNQNKSQDRDMHGGDRPINQTDRQSQHGKGSKDDAGMQAKDSDRDMQRSGKSDHNQGHRSGKTH